MAAFRLSQKTAEKEFCGKMIIAGYQIFGFFSAKPENIEEAILQLKIPVATKFNVKPIGYIGPYCLFSVTQLITVTFKKSVSVAIVTSSGSRC